MIRGRDSSPESGACVMEVASMLADEDFTDEPQCVCPVIAEFLRTYNDEVDNELRQDLLGYASLAVGTRGTPSEERKRANVCLDWLLARNPSRLAFLRRLLWMAPPATAARDIVIAERAARWAAASPERHGEALALVETLVGAKPLSIDVGAAPQQPAPDESGTPRVLVRS